MLEWLLAFALFAALALVVVILCKDRAHAASIEAINAAWRRDMAAERDRHAKDRTELLNRIQRPETLGQAPADRKPRQPWSDQREADIARKQEEANGRPLR